VTPDLAVFGNALASGFPVAALAGHAEIMDLTHKGGVMHGGTYNAHPAGMAATVATLTEFATSDACALIEKRGRRLMDWIAGLFRDYQVIAHVQGFPAVFHVAIGSSTPSTNYRDSQRTDRADYVRFATAMLTRGVRALERGAWFLSVTHDDAVIDRTLSVVEDSVKAWKQ
jgi:glutamate-1-semialdehyde 2,1-aminomutase